MKKELLFSILVLLFIQTVFAQDLKTTKTINKAIENSIKLNKPILIIIEFDRTGLKPKTDSPVNSRLEFKSAIEDTAVVNKFNDNLITYKTISRDTSIIPIIKKAKLKTYPAYVFINQFKDVIYKDFGNSNNKNKYLKMVDSALLAFKEKPISQLEKEFETNKSNNLLLKKLIEQRKKSGITNNAELIEQYVKNLTIGDFNDYQNVLFILDAGPYADGLAYKMAYTNPKIVDSIYKKESLEKRRAFTSYILSNTMMEAAKLKSLPKAMAGANFIRKTNRKNFLFAEQAYQGQMLWYYNSIKDTANYINTAINYYDTFYMRLSADSIKKLDAKNSELLRKRDLEKLNKKIVSKEKIDSLINNSAGNEVYTTTFTTQGSPVSSYSNTLNSAAWKFYLTGTKNINHLTKAMIWSRRSIELNPLGAYYDTLVHILYRMGYYEEAIKTQEDALKISAKSNQMSPSMKESLKKMKTRTL
jgi:hypothetical protein